VLGGWGTRGSNRNPSTHLLVWPLCWLVLHLILALLFQPPLYITGDGEDLRIGFQLLWDEEHLYVHLKALLESAGPILLVIFHILCKPVKPQEFRSILINELISLL